MKRALYPTVAAVLSAGLASALENTALTDLAFAEAYAFSTNRAALIETFRPGTEAWYFLSVLNAENEGRLDKAEKLLDRWKGDIWSAKGNPFSPDVFGRYEQLRNRLRLLRADGSNVWSDPGIQDTLGMRPGQDYRDREVAPNTFPAALDPKAVSFASFWERGHGNNLTDRFRTVPYAAPGLPDFHAPSIFSFPAEAADAPGVFEEIVRQLKNPNQPLFPASSGVLRGLPLSRLEALQKEFAGTPRDISGDRGFAELVLRKLAPGAADDPNDPAVRRAWLDRILAFSLTLKPALSEIKALALANRIRLDLETGVLPDKGLFLEYLATPRASGLANAVLFKAPGGRWWNQARPTLSGSFQGAADVLRPVPDDAPLVREALVAFRRAGSDLSEFAEWVEGKELDRVRTETDLLAGKPAAELRSEVFTEDEFKAIQNRSELRWSPANPRVFAADGAVSLSIGVKNVPSMRLAVYDLDAFAACREENGEVGADIDLDGCVPTAERTLDYSAFAPARLHEETLALPELARPGLYVVECSGSGISSRALVRKGRIRIVHEPCASGELFQVLDEKGAAVKDFTLRVGTQVLRSDPETAAVVVPFAAAPSLAGEKLAIVGAGRLAGTVRFTHRTENYRLGCGLFLPTESLVAGQEATALLSPDLRLEAGRTVPVPLSALEKPVFTLELTDLDGVRSVRTFEFKTLPEDGPVPLRFRVPDRLRSVAFSLAGTVRAASTGKDVALCAEPPVLPVNGILRTDRIGHAFLRHLETGYRIELRGRQGEPLPNRVLEISFRHRAFEHPKLVSLQTGADGCVELGGLPDIESLALDGQTWRLPAPGRALRPAELHAVEGEAFEIPIPEMERGAWPGAEKFDARVSLLEKNSLGETVYDRLGAVAFTNGFLRIAGLPAGDYELRLRAESVRMTLRVEKAPQSIAADTIAGAARGLSDTGSPALPRLESVAEKDGKTILRFANLPADARLHVVARRYLPNAGTAAEGADPLGCEALRDAPEAVRWTWADPATTYLSGRALGDKLRYILERRSRPHRPGTMLDKPSLLLNPWNTTETRTNEIRARDGEDWDAPQAAMAPKPSSGHSVGSRNGGYGFADRSTDPAFDFLPEGACVLANLRPDADGAFTIDDAALGGRQDVAAILACGAYAEEILLAGKAAPFKVRDLRQKKTLDPDKAYATRRACIVLAPGEEPPAAARARRCATVADLFGIYQSISKDPTLEEFAFVAKWQGLDPATKRDLYGKHPCHELDLFLWKKDPDFFQHVVAPRLASKRLPDFIDRFLLGQDLSAWADAARLGELNALEQDLLAHRVPAAREMVADRFRDACEARRPDPEDEARRFRAALDITGEDGYWADLEAVAAECVAFDGMEAEEEAPRIVRSPIIMRGIKAMRAPQAERPASDEDAEWSNQAVALNIAQPELKAARGGRKAKAAARPERQFYRPPESTKEWVETYYWKRLRSEPSQGLVPVSRFWLDLVRRAGLRTKTGGDDLSVHVLDAAGSFTERMAALAFTDLPFAEKDDAPGFALLFLETQEPIPGTDDGNEQPVILTQRFVDPADSVRRTRDGEDELRFVSDEFVAGRQYRMSVYATNPSAGRRRIDLLRQIPEGAIPLAGSHATAGETVRLAPFETREFTLSFYFPAADEGLGGVYPPAACEGGTVLGRADAVRLPVVAKPSTVDTTSWDYVSQNGSAEDVLAFLRSANLEDGIDPMRAAWRMADKDFYDKASAILDARGLYVPGLWVYAMNHKDLPRLKRWTARRDVRSDIARRVGPGLETDLVSTDAEETGLFEHKEYWPVINARAHTLGDGPTIPNASLAGEYRALLDTIAYKPAPTAGDRLLAAVFLIAQDRIDEAKAQLALVPAGDPAMRMQRAYLAAYLAFCDGKPEEARRLALPYRDDPVPVWSDRFGAILSQADEIAGRAAASVTGSAFAQAPGADAAPSLALAEAESGRVAITARNLAACTLRAFPMDIETIFSKTPFAAGDAAGSASVRPAWETSVRLGKDGRATVELPDALRRANLALEAVGADGRATARLVLVPGELDVQLLEEPGELRVRGKDGKPRAGAYVKVYVQGRGGSECRFHKDGYTDLRGAFPYAAVSTDSDLVPEKFAILVLDDTAGGKTLVAAPPAN